MGSNSKKVRKVLDYIDEHRDNLIDFLVKMISIPSVNEGTPGSGKELEIQNWTRDQFKQFGFDKVDYWAVDEKKVRPNVVGVLQGQSGGRSLIFQGHCDVVPVPETELVQWKYDPWSGIIADGKVHGRGASDMKSGNTALFWAARAIIDCGIKLQGDLFVESVVGEESSEGRSIGAAATVDRGYKAPFAIVAEPTNCEIHLESPGIFFFELIVRGKATHTASRNLVIFPQRYGIPNGTEVGADAISRMRLFLELFERLETQWNQRWRGELLGAGGYPVPLDKQGIGIFTINTSFIEGGSYLGAVPGYCKITCCIWYPNWIDKQEVITELKKHIQAIASTDDWMRENPPEFNAPIMQDWEPAKVSKDHQGVQTLVTSFKEATGRDAIQTGFKAVSDATFLGKKGIPSVVLGPGDLGMGTHGPNEYVPIEQVIECAKVYAVMAMNWCGVVD